MGYYQKARKLGLTLFPFRNVMLCDKDGFAFPNGGLVARWGFKGRWDGFTAKIMKTWPDPFGLPLQQIGIL